MCGIVGYIGGEQAAPFLLTGLQKLEYRGYDSAGVAVYNGTGIHVVKSKGRLSVLDGILQGGEKLPGVIGIGHTRWATHGAPSDVNSHPQVSDGGKFAVVHNGIIENYLELKNHLLHRGIEFVSDTDTEVVAQLLEYYYRGDVLEAISRVTARVEGSYALGIICADCPEKVFAVRKDWAREKISSLPISPPSCQKPGTSAACMTRKSRCWKKMGCSFSTRTWSL